MVLSCDVSDSCTKPTPEALTTAVAPERQAALAPGSQVAQDALLVKAGILPNVGLDDQVKSMVSKMQHDPEAFLGVLHENYFRIDLNRADARQSHISKQDLATFLHRPNLSVAQIAIATMLKDHFDQFASLSGRGDVIEKTGLDKLEVMDRSACYGDPHIGEFVGRGAAGGAIGGAIGGGLSDDSTAGRGAAQGAAVGAAIGAIAYTVEKASYNGRMNKRREIDRLGIFDIRC